MPSKMNLLLLLFLTASTICIGRVYAQEEEETDEDIIKTFLTGSKEEEGTKTEDTETESKEKEQTPEEIPPDNGVKGNAAQKVSGGGTDGDESGENLHQESVEGNNDNGNDSGQDVLLEQSPCACVKYYLCDINNGTIIDDGAQLLDIRLGNTQESPCKHYFDICCQKMKPPNPEPVKPDFKHSVCGKRNSGGVGFRITGGTEGESQFGEFPWMAAIIRQEPQKGKAPLNVFVCGASMISPSVAMTAAHCVVGKKVSEMKIRFGEWDTQTSDELYPHVDRYVKKVAIHEKYYAGALYNDIALLFLDQDVKFAPNIDTICLPPKNANFDGQNCFASGWGKDSFGQEGRYQVILKKVEVPIVPRDRCQASLRKTRLGAHFKLHSSFVCAGGQPGKDTCRGDGGSPLVCQLPNSPYYVQYGIVAWGIGCGEKGTPGVYVNIPSLVDWIDEKVVEEGLETRYYKHD